MGPSLYYFNTQQQEQTQQKLQQTITSRSFFKGNNNNSNNGNLLQASEEEFLPPVLTYGIRYNSELDQLANDVKDQQTANDIQIVAQCFVQTKFLEAENLLEVAVQYTSIEKSLLSEESENFEGNLSQEENGQENDEESEGELYDFEGDAENVEVSQRQNPFYVLYVDFDSGKIQKLLRENAYDEDQNLNWITQQLVNDLFPDARKIAYEHAQVEKDNLGEVLVEYKEIKVNEKQVLLTRDYDSEDLIQQYVPDVKNPTIDYDREVLMAQETGVVEGGSAVFDIFLGKEEQLLTLDENGEAEVKTVPFGGELQGKVVQDFWKIDDSELYTPSQMQGVAQEITKYRNEAELVNVFLLNHEQSGVELGDGEEEQLEIVDIDVEDDVEIIETYGADIEGNEENETQTTQNGTQLLQITPQQKRKLQAKGNVYRESTLASVKIFGSTVKVDMVYSGIANKNNVSVNLKVNNRVIKRIINISFNQCKTNSRNVQNQNQDLTLFKAYFPVFGIITINVSASTKIQFGYNTYSNGNNGNCQINVKPWLKTALYADGKASLAGVISAGIYAQGNFLDSALTLSAGATPYSSYANLAGDMHAFSVEVGLTYTKINCSLKNLRRLQDGSVELDEDEQNNRISHGRSLGLRRKLKKARRKVKKVVKKASTVAKKVYNGVKTVVHVAQNLHKICTTNKGYKQLYKSASKRQTKTFFNFVQKY
ncbi:hypothetical protein PPERSA_06218 [Pseudocohnilembus persalinus]|uniref:Uncharacterized protein n=1 Tax=Pseudocohnilembus persalinus TaxID=266149 RepID=A0A0V0R1L2_PSEPJ|nr:hypothetical protein PPERSA_06218 [Pseudocohnilembus persalinus]|eukprot:KRX08040.1 hypothetical protein PPERSA_06218 [Pseudocohnilembus persalinus]